MIDPSLGKASSDAQVVGLFYVYDRIPVLMELRIIQKSAPEMVKEVLQWAVEEGVPLVCAESVAYQASLLAWFEFMCGPEQLNIDNIVFAPVTPKARKKNSRIINWFKSLMEDLAKIHPNVLSRVLSQIMTFDPLSINNTDDILDVGAYGDDIVLEYPQELMLPDMLQLAEEITVGVQEENTTCF